MDGAQTLNGLQVSRTRTRLLVSRLFGAAILFMLAFGTSYWAFAPMLGFLKWWRPSTTPTSCPPGS